MKETKENALMEAYRSVPDGRHSGLERMDSGKIWDLVEGNLEEKEILEYADMAAEDPELAEAWHLALEIRREREHRKKLIPFRRHFSFRTFIALAAMLLVGVLIPLLFQKSSDQPLLRGSNSEEIVNLLGDTAALPRDNFILRWRDTSDQAVSCDLLLMRQDLTEIISVQNLNSGEYRVNPEQMKDLDRGENLLWQLKCHRHNGEIHPSRTWSILLDSP